MLSVLGLPVLRGAACCCPVLRCAHDTQPQPPAHSARSIPHVQASAWTWFAATSYGPMAPPEYLMEGSWQMSYWLMSTVLTISYGFFAGSYLYSTCYVCRLRIPDRTGLALLGPLSRSLTASATLNADGGLLCLLQPRWWR